MDIDMDIKELEAFVYVVENCSFSRAAELLHLTQPTISAHISALERKLGIKLVVRTTKETYPSDAGKLLYGYAKEILRIRENAAVALHNFSHDMRGNITIGVSGVPSRHHIPRLLQKFQEKYPEITFSIQMEDSPRVAELVVARSVEIGFCGTKTEVPKCVYQEFASEPMAVITPNTEEYRALLGKPFPIERLKDTPFIGRDKDSGTYAAASEILASFDLNMSQISVAVEARSTENVKQMVSEGLGIGIISCSGARDYEKLEKILVFPFEEPKHYRRLYIAKHKNNILSPIAQKFYDYACNYYKKVYE